ncbi:MAG: hypothetical protein EPO16_02820 [Dehalococcoidia bacterium]|nr:MAG: hypothetical protein EPO16_02820 [Dehalococcoidia bacterium]
MFQSLFRSLAHTVELMKTSWRVLMQDRELMVFPILSGIVVIVIAGIFAALAFNLGTFDRLSAAREAGAQASFTAADITLGTALAFSVTAVTVFFNAALISAALERLDGGDPTVRSGLRVASQSLPAVLVWAAISATIGLLLQAARGQSRGGAGAMLVRIGVAMVGGIWAYMTFFVVPVMVAERLGAVAAIKRSSALFRQTWGQQAGASFGFGLIYVGAALVTAAVAVPLMMVYPLLGIIAGGAVFAVAFGAVAAMEGIFKAALFRFASGQPSAAFDDATLRSAYRAL